MICWKEINNNNKKKKSSRYLSVMYAFSLEHCCIWPFGNAYFILIHVQYIHVAKNRNTKSQMNKSVDSMFIHQYNMCSWNMFVDHFNRMASQPHVLPSHKTSKTSGIVWVVPPTQDANCITRIMNHTVRSSLWSFGTKAPWLSKNSNKISKHLKTTPLKTI